MKNKGKYWKHGRRNLDPGREARPERAHLGVQMRSFQASSRIGPERCRKVTENKRRSRIKQLEVTGKWTRDEPDAEIP